jgi:hypothetical protein
MERRVAIKINKDLQKGVMEQRVANNIINKINKGFR